MAKARWAKGLRKGSTKTETYSTLATRKDGRIQVVKDRVYDVQNPQTDAQMQQRVVFATVTKAVEVMSELLGISWQGESRAQFAKQNFVSENVKYLRSVMNSRVGILSHPRAVFAPKGNKEIIPNSYIVSYGTLTLPRVQMNFQAPSHSLFDIMTGGNVGDNGESFQYGVFSSVGNVGGLPYGSYTVAQLWERIFGLKPGDQLTFPQIYVMDDAQIMLDGDYDGATIVDKTRHAFYAAPRVVLLSEMPETTVTVDADSLPAIKDALRSGLSAAQSYEPLVDNFLDLLAIDDTADDFLALHVAEPWDSWLGVNNDDKCAALGVILSRKDSKGNWQYNTCQLTCAWNFLSQDSGVDYWGFLLDNAIDTYRSNAQTDTNGNFLQRGGSPDVLPAGSFQ